VFVDFMSDDKTAMVKTEKEGTATALQMAEPGKPYTAAGGYSLTGNGDSRHCRAARQGIAELQGLILLTYPV
jgi:hypothetical protein